MQLIHNTIIKLGVVALLIGCVLTVNYLQAAWSPPLADPPNDNVDAPINIGTNDQVKNGGLSVDALAVFGGTYIQGASSTSPAPTGQVDVDVEGNVGASEYCDRDGTNCFSASQITGSGGSGGGGTSTPVTTTYWFAKRSKEQCGGSGFQSMGLDSSMFDECRSLTGSNNTPFLVGDHDVCFSGGMGGSAENRGGGLAQHSDGTWHYHMRWNDGPIVFSVICLDF